MKTTFPQRLILTLAFCTCLSVGLPGQTPSTATGSVSYFATSSTGSTPPASWTVPPGNSYWSVATVSGTNTFQLSGNVFNSAACAVATTPVYTNQPDPQNGGTHDYTLTHPNVPVTTGSNPPFTIGLNGSSSTSVFAGASPAVDTSLNNSKNWRELTDFTVSSFNAGGTGAFFRLGVGALGANPLFASDVNGTLDVGKRAAYLVDITLNGSGAPAGGTGTITSVPSIRIVRLNADGSYTTPLNPTNLTTDGTTVLYFITGHQYRLIVDGKYGSSGQLTLSTSVIDVTAGTSSLIYTANTDTAPLNGVYFGYRHSNGNSMGSVTVRASTFVAVNHVDPLNTYVGSNPFGTYYTVNGTGPNTTAGTAGYSYSYVEDAALTQQVLGMTSTKFSLSPSYYQNYNEKEPAETTVTSDLTTLASQGAAISHVLNMPFANYCIWTTTYKTYHPNSDPTGNGYQLSTWASPSCVIGGVSRGTPPVPGGNGTHGSVGQNWPTPHGLKGGNGVYNGDNSGLGASLYPSNLVAQSEYQEIYNLAHYLLVNYNYTGKSFYLGLREGDHELNDLEVFVNGDNDPNGGDTNPSNQSNVASQCCTQMANYLQIRQQAINDAMANTPHQDVNVYGYTEVSNFFDIHSPGIHWGSGYPATFNSWQNGYYPGWIWTEITGVLPKLTTIPIDFVAYSSWDSMKQSGGVVTDYLTNAYPYTGTPPITIAGGNPSDLQVISTELSSTGAPYNTSVTGTRIFLGEFGFKELGTGINSFQSGQDAGLILKDALGYTDPAGNHGIRFAFYWNTNDNGVASSNVYAGFGLIEPGSGYDVLPAAGVQNPPLWLQSTFQEYDAYFASMRAQENATLNIQLPGHPANQFGGQNLSQSAALTAAQNWFTANYTSY